MKEIYFEVADIFGSIILVFGLISCVWWFLGLWVRHFSDHRRAVAEWKAAQIVRAQAGSLADQGTRRAQQRRSNNKPDAETVPLTNDSAAFGAASAEDFSSSMPCRLSLIDEDWEAIQAQQRISQHLAD